MTATTNDKPPTREERKKCWKLRDEYFACLDNLNVLDPVIVEKQPDRATSCLEKKKHYEMRVWLVGLNTLISDESWTSDRSSISNYRHNSQGSNDRNGNCSDSFLFLR
ncbi:unnamed protein product [Absidia cylindrospora]